MIRLFTFIALFFVLSAGPVSAESLTRTVAKQAIVLDYDTGMVLFEKNADERMPTSSMSKVMTMYVVFDALKKGHIALDDRLNVSEKAWRKGGSKMFVEVGSRVKVEDLIRGVIVQSGNDATIVLAEGLDGTEDDFAGSLNEKAQKLGMKDSQFMNASGWPDPEHYSTARDMARLATAIIRDFPDYYGYYGEKEFTYNNITQKNRNPLLYRGIGADGVKTGRTDAGGYGLIGSAKRGKRRVVLVLNGLADERARARESAKLMEWALQDFENRTVFTPADEIAMADIVLGKAARVPLRVAEDLSLTVPRKNKGGIKVQVRLEEPLVAPVVAGQEIGVLEIDIPGLSTVRRPLYAAEDVARLGFFSLAFVKAKLFFTKGGVNE